MINYYNPDKLEEKILLVDDDEDYREIISVYLEDEGYQVYQADSGRKALEILAEYQPDLVLMDVMMPDMDGYEACRKIKQNSKVSFMPVVMLTVLDDQQEKLYAFEAGADDFLNKPVKRIELLVRVNSLLRIRFLSKEMENVSNILVSLVNIIEAKDYYTSGHSRRVASWSRLLAEEMGFSNYELETIYNGALLHDIGKIGIDQNILLKPEKLSNLEYKEIQRHPVIGEKICNPLHTFSNILPIIHHHHEKLDGSGYPDNLQGEEIPKSVRIVSIIDVYDSLTSRRVYREEIPTDKALDIIRREVSKNFWDEEVFFYLEKMALNGKLIDI